MAKIYNIINVLPLMAVPVIQKVVDL